MRAGRGVRRLADALPVRPPGPDGRRLCRRCAQPVPARRQNWCGDECVALAQIEAGHQGAMRHYLLRRDRGVCALCGLDTEALAAWVRRLFRREHHPEGRAYGAAWFRRHPETADEGWSRQSEACRHLLPLVRPRHDAALRDLARRGFRVHRGGFEISAWQADHVVPLIEGGTHGVENLRTLCLPCHKRETAELAARRARARRPQRELW